MARNYGIKAMEIYFPKTYVDQADLEKADECGGKYTKGLGQLKMGVCTNLEDINSVCLTVTNNLLKNFEINPTSIGFLEVGTESIIDKSKSTKSVLMQLFTNNADIQGVDVKNACFGGTAALFSALDWLESSNCDGREAIVVAGDIAVYSERSARCTGGAGAIAMLLGPNAPLVFDSGVRSHFMSHQWDFYKPKLDSEYPFFDGKKSVDCYQTALDNCYDLFRRKAASKGLIDSRNMLTEDDATFFCFHSPFSKLVQKSFARLVYTDLKAAYSHHPIEHLGDRLALLRPFLGLAPEDSVDIRGLESASMKFSESLLSEKIEPSLHMARNIGNMYTASLYSCLISLISNLPIRRLCGSRVVLFSYGSGLTSCMFSLKITRNPDEIAPLVSHLQLAKDRLEDRIALSPSQFEDLLNARRDSILKCSMKPDADLRLLFPGSYFLREVDDRYRRHYDVYRCLVNGDLI